MLISGLHEQMMNRKSMLMILTAITVTQQKNIEREHGIKYSVINELPYYDTVRHMAIDPMHLLFLGIHTLNTHLKLGNKRPNK